MIRNELPHKTYLALAYLMLGLNDKPQTELLQWCLNKFRRDLATGKKLTSAAGWLVLFREIFELVNEKK